jgi:hypothetical protein
MLCRPPGKVRRLSVPGGVAAWMQARVVGYNVHVAVVTEHHLIVTHEVTNIGSDRSQLANIASQAKDVLGADHLDVVADRGHFNSPEILACEQADIAVTMPKPMTSGAKSDGRFGKVQRDQRSGRGYQLCRHQHSVGTAERQAGVARDGLGPICAPSGLPRAREVVWRTRSSRDRGRHECRTR